MTTKHTAGPWKAVAIGGASVVLTIPEPARNDARIPAYGYVTELGYSVAYPFIDDEKGVRLDFVCFSHADARLIAAAPDLLEALEKRAQADAAYAQLALADVDPNTHEHLLQQIEDAEEAAKDAGRAAIAKARGAQ